MARALIESAPRTICLQISDDEFDHDDKFPASEEGITWCTESVMDCEVGYIRADIHELTAVELKESKEELTRLREELDALRKQEPVGCMSRGEYEAMTGGTVENGTHFRIWQMDNPPSRAKAGVKLYAAPVPAQPAALDIPAFLRRDPPETGKLPCKHCGTGYVPAQPAVPDGFVLVPEKNLSIARLALAHATTEHGELYREAYELISASQRKEE